MRDIQVYLQNIDVNDTISGESWIWLGNTKRSLMAKLCKQMH